MNQPHATKPKFASPSFQLRRPIERRAFLKGVGVGMALPFLEAMVPPMARAASALERRPMRMLCICNDLSVLPEHFFPKNSGAKYTLSPYLELLKEHRQDFTVFSGVHLPSVAGGHGALPSFLTAAPGPTSPSFRNTGSLDQMVAEEIGTQTRFPSLVLGVNSRNSTAGYDSVISFSGTGVPIPTEDSPSAVFRELFFQGSQAEVSEGLHRLENGQSILDMVASQARSLSSKIGTDDRQRMERYFDGVRELEKRLVASKEWALRPKPLVKQKAPEDVESPAEFMAKTRLIYDLSRLAFESDSTRVITILLEGLSTPAMRLGDQRLTDGYHNLSHHSQSSEKLKQLKLIDEAHMRQLGQLLADLKSQKEGGSHLLDHTMVFYGSNMGNASTHSTENLPALLAGGGFKHGQHLAFDTQNNYPLPNLYLSMLQRMGIEKDRFATSTGTMKGLEVAS